MGLAGLVNKIHRRLSSSDHSTSASPEITSSTPGPGQQNEGVNSASTSRAKKRMYQPTHPFTTPAVTSNDLTSDSASETTLTNELTAKEKALENALNISEQEKARSADERRKQIREYLRNSRDLNRYRMV